MSIYNLLETNDEIEFAAKAAHMTEKTLLDDWMSELSRQPPSLHKYIWLLYDISEWQNNSDVDDAAIWARAKKEARLHIKNRHPIDFTGI